MQYTPARESGRVNDGDKEMNFQMTRFTGHKKFLITLGVGAIALTAVACGSAGSVDEAPAGDPPPAQVGGDNSEFALGAPNGIGDSGGTRLADGELVKDTSTGGSVTGGAAAMAPAYDCDSTVSHSSTLYIEGEPIGYPADGKLILDLTGTDETTSLLVPAPGFENSDIPEMIVVDPAVDYPKPTLYDGAETTSVEPVDAVEIQDGSAIGMPIMADGPALTDEASAAPMPISGPPAMLPTPEQADSDDVDVLPVPAILPVYECESGSTSSSSSGSSGSSSGTIEPVEVVGVLIPVEPTDDERAANILVVEVPIESAGVTVAESSPPQYMLWVVSGLSNGATTFGDYAVKRDGNIVAISMTNYVQRDVMATQVYGIHQSNIALGSDFASGETYEVLINGNFWVEFTAQ
jgi:hypothetical protein